jgi:chromosome segregation ATPase
MATPKKKPVSATFDLDAILFNQQDSMNTIKTKLDEQSIAVTSDMAQIKTVLSVVSKSQETQDIHIETLTANLNETNLNVNKIIVNTENLTHLIDSVKTSVFDNNGKIGEMADKITDLKHDIHFINNDIKLMSEAFKDYRSNTDESLEQLNEKIEKVNTKVDSVDTRLTAETNKIIDRFEKYVTMAKGIRWFIVIAVGVLAWFMQYKNNILSFFRGN